MTTIINEMDNKFKVGDYIYKLINNIPIDKTIFKIIELKENKGGNWHDGYAINTIATIQSIKTDKTNVDEIFLQEYCIQHINYMCQVNKVFAKHVDK